MSLQLRSTFLTILVEGKTGVKTVNFPAPKFHKNGIYLFDV